MTRFVGLPLLITLALFASPAYSGVQKAEPIPTSGPEPSTPAFIGKVAKPDPFDGIRAAWTNPFMAPNPTNSVHNDPWQSDAYTQFGGPLGKSPKAFSSEFGRTCITLTFDSKGRLEATCTNLTEGPALYLLDPVTLDMLAFMQLPFVPPPAGTNPATNTTGGAYFYLDDRDRAVIATSDRKLMVSGRPTSGGEPGFEEIAVYAPTSCLDPDQRMPSALPDKDGRLWFVGRTNGTRRRVRSEDGQLRPVVLGEEIENSFAIASDGVYIVTDKAHVQVPRRQRPEAEERSGAEELQEHRRAEARPVQRGLGHHADARGSPDGRKSAAPAYVAITDNADPMNVVVYRAADDSQAAEARGLRGAGVQEGRSATRRTRSSPWAESLFAENNYGYDIGKFNDVIAGRHRRSAATARLVSEPGIARIDIDATARAAARCGRTAGPRAHRWSPRATAATA